MDIILIVVQIIVSLLLIGVILLQKTATDSIASIGSSVNAFAQNNSGGSALSKITMWFAAIFMINSLALSVVLDKKNNASPLSKQIEHSQEKKHEKTTESIIEKENNHHKHKKEKKQNK